MNLSIRLSYESPGHLFNPIKKTILEISSVLCFAYFWFGLFFGIRDLEVIVLSVYVEVLLFEVDLLTLQ